VLIGVNPTPTRLDAGMVEEIVVVLNEGCEGVGKESLSCLAVIFFHWDCLLPPASYLITCIDANAARIELKARLNSGMGQQMTQGTKPLHREIYLSEAALRQVKLLRDNQGQDLCLRVGVRQGGCSGMSYMMDFEDTSKITPQDEVFDYEGFKIVCDRKSLLYLYGLMLDYSDAMIGGGFQFTNPNASQTCGCGKSFGV